MDMNDVIALVNTNRGKGIKKNLNRMNFLLNELGNPQKDLKFIHVAGTNGKGSTSSMMMSILQEAGYSVGLFTSPHLVRVNERIRINDQFISDNEFITLTEKVTPIVEKVEAELNDSLYAFEILTALAFLYFATHQVDMIILEAGIGGRLDATNTISQSLVSVITSIGLDHVKMLGDTPEKIAKEKVAIVKPHGHLVTYDAPMSIRTIFEENCDQRDAQLRTVDESQLHLVNVSLEKQQFDYKDKKDIKISMLGSHQVRNALLAIEVMDVLKEKGFIINEEHIYKGLKENVWPGRWEKISDQPLTFMDGAHNESAVAELVETIDKNFPKQKVTFMLGMLQGKDYKKMIELVLPKASKFLTLSPISDRAVEGNELFEDLTKRGFDAQHLQSPKEALDYIFNQADKEEVIIIFGSLYLVGNIKEELNKIK